MPTENTACCRECGQHYELPAAPSCGHSQMPVPDSPLGQLLSSFKLHRPADAQAPALARLVEKACLLNCDAESACTCYAHELYRAAVLVLNGTTSDK